MREADIRPAALFEEYLRLCAQDARTYFDAAARLPIACPACGADGAPAFTKNGFAYELCAGCDSLYVSPRPVASAFESYYTSAPSSKYWASTFYRETAESRRRLLWQPKARLVAELLARLAPQGCAIVDVGGGYGLFAEEVRALTGAEVVVIEPAPHLAEICRSKSLRVVEKFLQQAEPSDLPRGRKAFVSFELFEHLHDPLQFVQQLCQLMEPGDPFIFTTLSGTGLDIQLLWEQSKSVSPPHHLNFLNPGSVTLLLRRAGLEVIEVTTPGKLDVDILMNAASHITDRFWRNFLRLASDTTRAEWQQLIAKTGWSSHMLIVSRRP
jgi:SAM-dependent methyltransferase